MGTFQSSTSGRSSSSSPSGSSGQSGSSSQSGPPSGSRRPGSCSSSQSAPRGSRPPGSCSSSQSAPRGSRPPRRPQRPQTPEPAIVWPESSTRWQKLYDVYVCSSVRDISYAQALATYLHEQPERLRCFLPALDTNPGGAIPTELTDGAENSHCWVLLLTTDFLSDAWCHYQMHQFLSLAPILNGRLIPVLVGLTLKDYPRELRLAFAYQTKLGDQTVFGSVRQTILTYLRDLPTVPAEQSPSDQTNSSSLECSPSSSVTENGPVPKSSTRENPGDSTRKSSATQDSSSDESGSKFTNEIPMSVFTSGASQRSSITEGAHSDTNVRSLRTHDHTDETFVTKDSSVGANTSQEPLGDISDRRSITRDTERDRSMRSLITQDHAGDMSEKSSVIQKLISNSSMGANTSKVGFDDISDRRSITRDTEGDRSMRSLVTQDHIDGMSKKSFVTQKPINDSSIGANARKDSLDEIINRRSITQDTQGDRSMRPLITQDNTEDRSEKSSVTQKTLCDSSMGATTSPEPVGDISQKRSITSVSETSSVTQKPFRDPLMGATISQETVNQKESCTTCPRSMKVEKQSQSLQSDLYTSAGGSWVENQVTQSLQDDMYNNGVETKTGIVYDHRKTNTGCPRSEADQKPPQRLQSDIYTSVGGVWVENRDSKFLQDDIYSNGVGTWVENRITENLEGDVHSNGVGAKAIFKNNHWVRNTRSTVEEKQPQCLQSDLYTSCGGALMENHINQSLTGAVYRNCVGAKVMIKNNPCVRTTCRRPQEEENQPQSIVQSDLSGPLVEDCSKSLQSYNCGAIQAEIKYSMEVCVRRKTKQEELDSLVLKRNIYGGTEAEDMDSSAQKRIFYNGTQAAEVDHLNPKRNFYGGTQSEDMDSLGLQSNIYDGTHAQEVGSLELKRKIYGGAQAQEVNNHYLNRNIYGGAQAQEVDNHAPKRTIYGRIQAQEVDSMELKREIYDGSHAQEVDSLDLQRSVHGGTSVININSQLLQRELYNNQTEIRDSRNLHPILNTNGQPRNKSIQSNVCLHPNSGRTLKGDINSNTNLGHKCAGFWKGQGDKNTPTPQNDFLHCTNIVDRSTLRIPNDIYTSCGGNPTDLGVPSGDLYLSSGTDQTRCCAKERNPDSLTSRDLYCSHIYHGVTDSVTDTQTGRSFLQARGADRTAREAKDNT